MVGLIHATASDNSQGSTKTDWDDESMILPSTTSETLPSAGAITSEGSNKESNYKQQPRFISLIPTGHHEIPQVGQKPAEDISRGTVHQNGPAPPENEGDHNSQEQDDMSPTTPEDTSASEEVTTEAPKLHFIQLGKVPLTIEDLPLLPEQDHLFGRQNERPIGFFPEQVGEPIMVEKANILRNEQEKQQRQRSTQDPRPRQGDSSDMSPEPLTYMVPPRREAKDYWSAYNTEVTDSLLPNPTTENIYEVDTSTTINPILERLRAFLQKSKRHSIELQASAEERKQEYEQTTKGLETTTQEDDSASSSTTEDLESGDQIMTSPAPIVPSVEQTPSTTLSLPRPRIPHTMSYEPAELQPLSYRSVNIPSTDQHFSDYSLSKNILEDLKPVNYYYYSNSNPNSVGMISLALKPPARTMFTSGDSYWPQRYFYGGDADVNTMDYPFIRYNDDYRSQRNSRLVYPIPSVLSSINEQRPYYGSFGNVGYGYNSERDGNMYSPKFNRDFTNPSQYRYSYPSPSSYLMNSGPLIPYRPYYSSSSSPVANNLMYAPLYSYQQFRRFQSPQPQPDYL